jgi:predicted DNA-binding transcriptional regulator AlpA
MTPDLQAIRTELQQMRQLLQTVVATQNRHLDRHEMAQRLGISTSTLDRRVKARTVPAPVNGKWSLATVVEWEASQQQHQPTRNQNA